MAMLVSLLAAAALQAAAPPLAPPIELDPPQGEGAAPTGAPDPLPERLNQRLDALGAAEDAQAAAPIADQVLSLWRQMGGPTAALLLQRASEAREAGDLDTAARQYFHLRALEPELSEAWVGSAEIAAARSDWGFALEALERAVAIEPRRFDAYLLLGRALEQADEPEAALAAYEAALEIHPRLEPARQAQARLERRLSGRAL